MAARPRPARNHRRGFVLALLAALVACLVGAQPRGSAPAVLTVPVEGVRRRDLVSTFGAPRDGGRRRHEGADIFSRRGTPVVAAADGRVLRVGVDPLGGRVVSVLGSGRRVYYYAHLEGWADGLKRGQRVREGQALGRVGNTGNARTTPSHLHFGIYQLGLFGARPLDPVPLLQVWPAIELREGAALRARRPALSAALRRGP